MNSRQCAKLFNQITSECKKADQNIGHLHRILFHSHKMVEKDIYKKYGGTGGNCVKLIVTFLLEVIEEFVSMKWVNNKLSHIMGHPFSIEDFSDDRINMEAKEFLRQLDFKVRDYPNLDILEQECLSLDLDGTERIGLGISEILQATVGSGSFE